MISLKYGAAATPVAMEKGVASGPHHIKLEIYIFSVVSSQ